MFYTLNIEKIKSIFKNGAHMKFEDINTPLTCFNADTKKNIDYSLSFF